MSSINRLAITLCLFAGACGGGDGGPSEGKGRLDTSVSRLDTTPSSQAVPGASDTGGLAAGTGFTGYWTWSNDRDGLTLSLVQSGTRLEGHHEAWEQYGDKVDAVSDDEIASIHGMITGNVAKVTFRSGVSGSTGVARLTLGRDGLSWETVTQAQGECYVPRTALLRRGPPDDEERPQVDEGAAVQREERAARQRSDTTNGTTPQPGSTAPAQGPTDKVVPEGR